MIQIKRERAMGLLKGTFTFSKYRVEGEPPAKFLDFVDGKLKTFSFRGMPAGSDETAMGWTSMEDPLDVLFERGGYIEGDYVIFTLRVDRRTVPSSLVKVKTAEAEKEFLARHKQERIFREQKKEIRETVRQELLGRALPVPSFYDVCWCISGKWLLFGALGEKLSDDFEKLFERCFGIKIHPWTFVDESSGAGSPEEPVKAAALRREFLTWLWFRSGERDGMIRLPGGEISARFARRLVLESGEGDYTDTVVCNGMNSGLREGKAALREGKKVREARIFLGCDNNECEFTFKADRFSYQSFKFPPPPEQDRSGADRAGHILDRIYLLEKAVEAMENLFSEFSTARKSGRWKSEIIPKMLKWIEKDRS